MHLGNTMPDTRDKFKAFTATINNFTPPEKINVYAYLKGKCDKFIIGEEVGEGGTPHLQIYARFKTQRRFGEIKTWLPRAHIERARGNAQQNYEYCSKDGNFVAEGFTDEER